MLKFVIGFRYSGARGFRIFFQRQNVFVGQEKHALRPFHRHETRSTSIETFGGVELPANTSAFAELVSIGPQRTLVCQLAEQIAPHQLQRTTTRRRNRHAPHKRLQLRVSQGRRCVDDVTQRTTTSITRRVETRAHLDNGLTTSGVPFRAVVDETRSTHGRIAQHVGSESSAGVERRRTLSFQRRRVCWCVVLQRLFDTTPHIVRQSTRFLQLFGVVGIARATTTATSHVASHQICCLC